MSLVATTIVALLALIHVYILVLEMFLWDTPKGRKAFEKIASEHERWVVELFGGIGDADRHQLYDLLGRLRVQLSTRHDTPETP